MKSENKKFIFLAAFVIGVVGIIGIVLGVVLRKKCKIKYKNSAQRNNEVSASKKADSTDSTQG